MRAVLATHDLLVRKAHLMPWRVLNEVAQGIRARDGSATLASLDQVDPGDGVHEGLVRINKHRDRLRDQLQQLIRQERADVLFWPVAWREPGWRLSIIGELPIAKVAYFPGGVYETAASFYAARRIGTRAALPYVAESLVPKRRLLGHLRKAGFSNLIALTATTASAARQAGWPAGQVVMIPPGRDEAQDLAVTAPGREFEAWLGGDPYFLFMGPPSAIRGVFELLDAFGQLAARDSRARLVCLFRPDDELDAAHIRERIARSPAADRIYAQWQNLARPRLNGYISTARAVVMPFVLVPSEVPLAILETMAFGRPVITTSPGGTGDFVAQFGAAPPVGDIDALARAMQSFLDDEDVARRAGARAAELYRAQPGWAEVAALWAEAGRHAIEGASNES